MKQLTVTVVGGGVLGATLGVLARLLDVRVRLIAAQRVDRVKIEGASPDFASVFPAASVVPHSVRLDRAEETLKSSLEVFAALARQVPGIVRSQWHYEIFEGVVPEALYLPLLSEVEPLSSEAGAGCPLQRSAEVPVSGWRMRSFFVEAPAYLKMLYRLFERLGGTIESRMLRGPEELRALPGDCLIVCAGMGTPELIGRREEKHFEEGHLLHLPISLSDLATEPASYNYTPLAHVHPGPGGRALDVYAYPRRGSLVLGGTRLPGVQSPDGAVTVDAYAGRTLALPGAGDREIRVPEAILRLNRRLLRQLLALDISKVPATAFIGRRYRGRSPDAAITMSSEILWDRPVVSSYGLGGGGVTLSWGLAARLLLEIRSALPVGLHSISEVLTADLIAHLATRAESVQRASSLY